LKLPRIHLPHWSPAKWTFIGANALAAYGLYLLARYGITDAIDPRNWAPVQYVGISLMLLMGVGLFAQSHIWFGRLDQVWDEVDELRAEVGSLREVVHAGHPGTTEVPEAQEDPTEGDDDATGPIPVVADPARPATGPLPTISGIPSARPPVPTRSTGATAYVPGRGRHAAPEPDEQSA